MSAIRKIEISNFRTIKKLTWDPNPGLNCLIGPGDSGKSTLLDAIDLTLGARRSYTFSDADFYQLAIHEPIIITITIGNLSEYFKNLEKYSYFLRSYNSETKQIIDEPTRGNETVLSIRLTVNADLEPDWSLYSARAEEDGIERRLDWKHRELLSPVKLGTSAQYNLSWSGRSVLNKLSENSLDVTSLLATLGRQTREAFAEKPLPEVSDVLEQVQQIGCKLGVPLGNLAALLDVNGVSLSNGAISLHNEDGTPLRQLGTGSARLLMSGLQQAASSASIVLIDEAEYGLEPYRITTLLHTLGSKEDDPQRQVFMTTHSPYVLRELKAQQLHVIRKQQITEDQNPLNTDSHEIFRLMGGNEEQSTLRVCAEAFFSKSVIVCEGKTEVGLVRGLDLYCEETGCTTINAKGVYCADGGGSTMFTRAKVFASLGYPTAVFKDSDKATEDAPKTEELINKNIPVFEWNNNYATEQAIFADCPERCIQSLLNFAIERKTKDSINDNIINSSQNHFQLTDCQTNFQNEHRACLGLVAKKFSWYKDIEPAEKIAKDIVAPNFDDFGETFKKTIVELMAWANRQ